MSPLTQRFFTFYSARHRKNCCLFSAFRTIFLHESRRQFLKKMPLAAGCVLAALNQLADDKYDTPALKELARQLGNNWGHERGSRLRLVCHLLNHRYEVFQNCSTAAGNQADFNLLDPPLRVGPRGRLTLGPVLNIEPKGAPPSMDALLLLPDSVFAVYKRTTSRVSATQICDVEEMLAVTFGIRFQVAIETAIRSTFRPEELIITDNCCRSPFHCPKLLMTTAQPRKRFGQ